MILMKIDGVAGDNKVSGYDSNWFAVDSLNWAIERELKESAKAGTRDINVGVAEIQPVTLGKSMDKASADLMYASISKGSLGTSEIHFLNTKEDGGLVITLKFKLAGVIIKSWSISGSEDERPTEEFALEYNKIFMEYYMTEDGKTYASGGSRGWDRVGNASWGG